MFDSQKKQVSFRSLINFKQKIIKAHFFEEVNIPADNSKLVFKKIYKMNCLILCEISTVCLLNIIKNSDKKAVSFSWV